MVSIFTFKIREFNLVQDLITRFEFHMKCVYLLRKSLLGLTQIIGEDNKNILVLPIKSTGY